jgi:hypothetical protein
MERDLLWPDHQEEMEFAAEVARRSKTLPKEIWLSNTSVAGPQRQL